MAAHHDKDPSVGSQCVYLDQIKPFILFWDTSEDAWGVKDVNLRYVYANPAFSRLLGLPKTFSVVGLSDKELPCLYANLWHEHSHHDIKVIENRKLISSIDIRRYHKFGSIEPYIFDKYPLFNELGESDGIVFHGRKILFFSLSMLLAGQRPFHFDINIPTNKFSKKEWRLICLINSGLNAKSISIYLKCNERTISNAIGRIYKKAGVTCLEDFITYCNINEFYKYFHNDFISERFFLLDI